MNKHRYIILLIFLLGCNSQIKTQIGEKENISNDNIEIYLEYFDSYFIPDSCSGKVNLEIPDSNAILRLYIKNCEGDILFKLENKNSELLIEGAYSKSLDTLKKYLVGKSAITGESKVIVSKYFQPLPDGNWVYYHNNKIIKKEKYKDGILQLNE